MTLSKVKKIVKSPLQTLKDSKGVMTAKGVYINYREAHKCQYGFFKGFATFRPSKLTSKIEANRMSFSEYESENKHYSDTCMVAGYMIKYGLLAGGSKYVIPLVGGLGVI